MHACHTTACLVLINSGHCGQGSPENVEALRQVGSSVTLLGCIGGKGASCINAKGHQCYLQPNQRIGCWCLLPLGHASLAALIVSLVSAVDSSVQALQMQN